MYIVSTIIVLGIRQCASWASTLITHKHSLKKKATEIRETCAQSLTPFWTYFRLELYLLHLLSLPLPSHYVSLLSSLKIPKPCPSSIPDAIGVGLSSPPPPALDCFWRSLSWSLKRLLHIRVRHESNALYYHCSFSCITLSQRIFHFSLLEGSYARFNVVFAVRQCILMAYFEVMSLNVGKHSQPSKRRKPSGETEKGNLSYVIWGKSTVNSHSVPTYFWLNINLLHTCMIRYVWCDVHDHVIRMMRYIWCDMYYMIFVIWCLWYYAWYV